MHGVLLLPLCASLLTFSDWSERHRLVVRLRMWGSRRRLRLEFCGDVLTRLGRGQAQGVLADSDVVRSVLGDGDPRQKAPIGEQLANADDYGCHRVLRDQHRKPGFLVHVLVEFPEHRHATGQHHAALVNVA